MKIEVMDNTIISTLEDSIWYMVNVIEEESGEKYTDAERQEIYEYIKADTQGRDLND